jgi:hypothetical protein
MRRIGDTWNIIDVEIEVTRKVQPLDLSSREVFLCFPSGAWSNKTSK